MVIVSQKNAVCISVHVCVSVCEKWELKDRDGENGRKGENNEK